MIDACLKLYVKWLNMLYARYFRYDSSLLMRISDWFNQAVICLLFLSVTNSEIHSEFKEIINFINSGEFSWKATVNPVTRLGKNAGVLAGSLHSRGSVTLTAWNGVQHSKIPESFDARSQWANCPSIQSIKDQGHCGSCWAVSTASVMSDRVCVASGGNTRVNISAEQLTACCVDCGVGCNGGYPDKAWPYFIRHGLVSGGDYGSQEGCQPYAVPHSGNPGYQRCSPKSCTNKNYTNPYEKDLHYGKTAYFLPNDVESIQAEIMANGPVVAGFTVYSDFPTYSKGIYQHVTGEELGGHAVRILGWGAEGDLSYWLIANSWNRTWGDNGYVKFIRGVNNCGIEEFVTAGLVEPN